MFLDIDRFTFYKCEYLTKKLEIAKDVLEYYQNADLTDDFFGEKHIIEGFYFPHASKLLSCCGFRIKKRLGTFPIVL